MLLSAVSFLVVVQSSSEIPEGLMNNPVLLHDFNSVACMLTPAFLGGGGIFHHLRDLFRRHVIPKRRCQPIELNTAKHPNAKM